MILKGDVLLAYTAGIMDGEGSISIHKRLEHGYPTKYLTICVTNTNEWLIQLLKMQFGGYIYFRKNTNPAHKDAWGWTLGSQKASAFLKSILPYLQIKRPQAELAIQFQDRRRRGRWTNNKTPEIRAVEEANSILMSSYNKRGK